MRGRRGLAIGMSIAVAGLSAPAYAGDKPHSVAVLEFRAGTAGIHNIGARLAQLLRKETSHPIVDEEDARRIGGARIDDAVARCSGEPRCVAQLGLRLGVDEVLLVGVSDLGDTIVAFQRVDSRTGAVSARVADSLAKDNEPDDAALDGYLKRLYPREDFTRYGSLRIEANVTGASVDVNGKRQGLTPIPPLRLPAPSKLDLRVSKSGYQDFRASVELQPDSEIAVRPVLTRGASTAWYQKPWFWAIVGAVVVGGVVTVVVLTSESAPTHVPVTVTF